MDNKEIVKELREMAEIADGTDFAAWVSVLLAAADIVDKYESEKEVLSTVCCATVAELRERHLTVLRESNKKDMPSGFDSWESYHKHIIQILSERDTLKTEKANMMERWLESETLLKLERDTLSAEVAGWKSGYNALIEGNKVLMEQKHALAAENARLKE
jgi:uncharacterized protein YecA (UPF0149 family)